MRTINTFVDLQDYPGEELLLVYDYDFRYGENFYVCLTEEAKDWVLNVSCLHVEMHEICLCRSSSQSTLHSYMSARFGNELDTHATCVCARQIMSMLHLHVYYVSE